MIQFKPGDKVIVTNEFKQRRPDLDEYFDKIFIVSSELNYQNLYKVFRYNGNDSYLTATSFCFRLADPIWLKQKDK